MRDINANAKKFMEETTPVVKASTQKLIPLTLGPLLSERFTEGELRQLVVVLESPVKHKFETRIPEMKKVLGEKIASDTRRHRSQDQGFNRAHRTAFAYFRHALSLSLPVNSGQS